MRMLSIWHRGHMSRCRTIGLDLRLGLKQRQKTRFVQIKGFKDYVNMYLVDKFDSNGDPLKVAFESVSDRWEVAVTVSDDNFQQVQNLFFLRYENARIQVSFVNSIHTLRGGRHVDHVTEQLIKSMIEKIRKKSAKSSVTIKPFQVSCHTSGCCVNP